MKTRIALVVVAVSLILMFAGLAEGAQVFNVADIGKPEVQKQIADEYVTGDPGVLGKIKKVAIAEFTVSYLTGFEEEDYNTDYIRSLQFEDPVYAQGSNYLYDVFVKKLTDAGYSVVPYADVKADKNFQELAGNETEDFITYYFVKKQTVKYRMIPMIPAREFKVTGGGVGAFGMGIANNAMAQMGNSFKYPRITQDLGADATLVVHLTVGHNGENNMYLMKMPNDSGMELMRIYAGYNDDGNGNVSAKDTVTVNLDKNFTLDGVGSIGENARYDWTADPDTLHGGTVSDVNFKDYLEKCAVLEGSIVDAAVAKGKGN
ncbi:MAG: hypothetical protein NT099_09405 [Candidatus Saganbacteria bacterium]|nr:hypothetical protein [Candidatus Saganbacteria bacterium]